MKKFIIFIIATILLLFAGFAHAKVYHIFFIDQKQTFNVGGTDYDAWVITVDSTDYYFMEPGDPRPEGYTVRDIIGILASSGVNDMIYYVTNNTNQASIASQAAEYAGGSEVSTASAYLTFSILSVYDKAGHEPFPPRAALEKAINCQWQGSGGLKTVEDWITAGYPITNFQCMPTIEVLGVK